MVNRPEVSLYFHIPFCNKKCPYCHFYVISDKKSSREALLKGLFLEWDRIKKDLANCEIVSIYFGGGTPTLFESAAIRALIDQVRAQSHVRPDCEITIEANPEDVTSHLMKELKLAGINRVSIGIQSLLDESLIQLGRNHTAQKGLEAIEITYNCGIENISIDVMFELPNQTPESFQKTLQKIDPLPITHLSLYNLTIEPHTPFAKRKLPLPSPEDNLIMLQSAISHFEAIGLERYEISAFARPGYRSKHNTGYWEGRPFLGLGPSAFSYWGGSRFQNVPNLNRYLKALEEGQSAIHFCETLPYPDNVNERLAVNLRLLAGVDLTTFDFPQKTSHKIDALQKNGFLCVDNHLCQLTPSGLLFYDTVASELI